MRGSRLTYPRQRIRVHASTHTSVYAPAPRAPKHLRIRAYPSRQRIRAFTLSPSHSRTHAPSAHFASAHPAHPPAPTAPANTHIYPRAHRASAYAFTRQPARVLPPRIHPRPPHPPPPPVRTTQSHAPTFQPRKLSRASRNAALVFLTHALDVDPFHATTRSSADLSQ